MTEPVELHMSEADARFAARLAEDVERVLGIGIVITDIAIATGGQIEIRAACLVDGVGEELVVSGETLLDASRALIRAAAELRLARAWNQLMAPI